MRKIGIIGYILLSSYSYAIGQKICTLEVQQHFTRHLQGEDTPYPTSSRIRKGAVQEIREEI